MGVAKSFFAPANVDWMITSEQGDANPREVCFHEMAEAAAAQTDFAFCFAMWAKKRAMLLLLAGMVFIWCKVA